MALKKLLITGDVFDAKGLFVDNSNDGKYLGETRESVEGVLIEEETLLIVIDTKKLPSENDSYGDHWPGASEVIARRIRKDGLPNMSGKSFKFHQTGSFRFTIEKEITRVRHMELITHSVKALDLLAEAAEQNREADELCSAGLREEECKKRENACKSANRAVKLLLEGGSKLYDGRHDKTKKVSHPGTDAAFYSLRNKEIAMDAHALGVKPEEIHRMHTDVVNPK